MSETRSSEDSAGVMRRRIEKGEAVVAVVGLGYVGLPLLRLFFEAGLPVIGFDIDPGKVEALNAGRSYIRHLGDEFAEAMARSDRFTATTDPARLAEADAVLICVPTPLGSHHEPDLHDVQATAEMLASRLRPGQLIVLESTTYPGTTREVVMPRLERSGRRIGVEVFLAYSPEREDPGRADRSARSIPKLVGGVDPASGELAVMLYQRGFEHVLAVASAEIAEAAKLLENIYRAVNIALVNELKVLLTAMGIDVWQVIDAASTKPFGFQRFTPGPGLGGHCIPVDPFYLAWKARSVGLPTRFIELAGEVNHAMPDYVVQRLALALNDEAKPVRGARLLLLGLAYKPNVDDPRESPTFELITKLRGLGAEVAYHDPHIPRTPAMRRYGDLNMTSIDWSLDRLGEYDALVVVTAHDWYDWPAIADHARLILDTRGVTRGLAEPRARIVHA